MVSPVNILLYISKYSLFWCIEGFKWFLSMPYWGNKFSILHPFCLKRHSKCFAKQVIINRWHYIFLRIGQSDTSKIIIKFLYIGFFWKSGNLCSTEWQNIFIIAQEILWCLLANKWLSMQLADQLFTVLILSNFTLKSCIVYRLMVVQPIELSTKIWRLAIAQVNYWISWRK